MYIRGFFLLGKKEKNTETRLRVSHWCYYLLSKDDIILCLKYMRRRTLIRVASRRALQPEDGGGNRYYGDVRRRRRGAKTPPGSPFSTPTAGGLKSDSVFIARAGSTLLDELVRARLTNRIHTHTRVRVLAARYEFLKSRSPPKARLVALCK